jgi:hypothetical protein
MKRFWQDKIAIVTSLVGVGLMVLTIIWHINPVEGSVMPHFLTSSPVGVAVICILLATCLLVWLPTVSLVTFIPLSEHIQYIIACGIMIMFQFLVYFMIGKLISLCARKLSERRKTPNQLPPYPEPRAVQER